MATIVSHGKLLWTTLLHHLRAYQHGSDAVTQVREVIWGVTPQGYCINGLTADACLARARNILVKSGRIYRWEDTICHEVQESEHEQLLVLGTRQKAQSGAAAVLSNLFCVGVLNGETSTQALPPGPLVSALLADEELWRLLPVIKHYGRRSVFDSNYNLCGPGWHSDAGILVHGPDMTPFMPPLNLRSGATAIDRLPQFTRTLLREFCWRSEADLTNALAFLLTGTLINHFIDQPHPIAIIDANQPGVGKTLFAQSIGRVLDGCEPRRIPLGKDEELEKKLCAHMLDGRSSIFFFDNVRHRIESALIEANVLSPLLCFRILGKNLLITRPNAYLWLLTSNLTSGTSDLLRRGLPIRIYYEGDLKKRTFTGNPLEYASQHRLEILGELAGMILHWKQQGMQPSHHHHRCHYWAETIGGILAANGFDQFLVNLEEAEADMDETLQALAVLAEHVVGRSMMQFFALAGDDSKDRGKPPRDWTALFLEEESGRDKLIDRPAKGRDTWVGQFLAGKVDSTVDITTSQGIGTATLRKREGRSRQKVYFFEIVLTPEQDGAPPMVVDDLTVASDPAVRVNSQNPVTGEPPEPAPPSPLGGVDLPPTSGPKDATAASLADAGSEVPNVPEPAGEGEAPGNDLVWD